MLGMLLFRAVFGISLAAHVVSVRPQDDALASAHATQIAVEVTGQQHLQRLHSFSGGDGDSEEAKLNVTEGRRGSSLAAVHGGAATTFGCRDLQVQCRRQDRSVKIHRAKTAGQHLGTAAGGVVMVFGFFIHIATVLAVAEARQNVWDPNKQMSGTDFVLVQQHGLFGGVNTQPITLDAPNVACSTINVEPAPKMPLGGKIDVESLPENGDSMTAEWPSSPSSDALSRSACKALETNFDILDETTIKAYLNACVQHSALCGDPGLCFYKSQSEFEKSDGKSCPPSLLDLPGRPVPAGGVLLAMSFGRPEKPVFVQGSTRSSITRACWSESGTCDGHDSNSGLVISVQDLQMGERCVMTLQPKEVESIFANLLAPRGIITLPGDYKIRDLNLPKLPETGTASGCDWDGMPSLCSEGYSVCGKAKGENKCGTFSKDDQLLCCPSVDLGIQIGTKQVNTIDGNMHGAFVVEAAFQLGGAVDKYFKEGDVVLAVAGGGLKPGHCVTRAAIIPIMKNWMYGQIELRIWIGRKKSGVPHAVSGSSAAVVKREGEVLGKEEDVVESRKLLAAENE